MLLLSDLCQSSGVVRPRFTVGGEEAALHCEDWPPVGIGAIICVYLEVGIMHAFISPCLDS